MARNGQGRPSKPTSLKLLHGDHKKNPQRINNAEPVPALGDVVPPEGLSDGALAVWHRLAPDLTAKGVLTAWDTAEFAVVCDAVARHRVAAQRMDQETEYSLNRFEERVVSPTFRVWMDTAALLVKVGGRFGLSPSDRAALKVGDGANKDPKADLLSG
jgi:P27 family predicted phage terminase small subunit